MISMPKVRLLSYNIDGLNDCKEELVERMMIIMGLIISEDPDVIHLQEVVPEALKLILQALHKQDYLCSDQFFSMESILLLGPYFTLSFVKKRSYFKNISFQRIPFTAKYAQSEQGRDIIRTEFQIINYEQQTFTFFNTHLESCGTPFRSRQSQIRQEQFRNLLSMIKSCQTGNAILSGDLNLRDNEANYILKEFNKEIIDVIQEMELKKTGPVSSKGNLYSSAPPLPITWVMPGKPEVQFRFDRCYYLKKDTNANGSNKSQIPLLTPVSYMIVGNEDILDEGAKCGYLTPSDHYALLIEFALSPSPAASPSSSSSTLPNEREQQQAVGSRKREHAETVSLLSDNEEEDAEDQDDDNASYQQHRWRDQDDDDDNDDADNDSEQPNQKRRKIETSMGLVDLT